MQAAKNTLEDKSRWGTISNPKDLGEEFVSHRLSWPKEWPTSPASVPCSPTLINEHVYSRLMDNKYRHQLSEPNMPIPRLYEIFIIRMRSYRADHRSSGEHPASSIRHVADTLRCDRETISCGNPGPQSNTQIV
jgi:hypothetical protein